MSNSIVANNSITATGQPLVNMQSGLLYNVLVRDNTSADITEPKMKAHMARSADNSKSGRNGYRPPGHARDNIPKKVTTKKGEVGWELNGDAQNWFYMKFVEWGTSKMPPRDFLNNTKSECESEYHMIADQEYQKALNEKLGG